MAAIQAQHDSNRRRLEQRLQRLLDEGNARRVRISQGDKTLIEFPLTLGVIGGLLAPQVAAAGVNRPVLDAGDCAPFVVLLTADPIFSLTKGSKP